jgi:Skp family chaperone for outer membrane proteins
MEKMIFSFLMASHFLAVLAFAGTSHAAEETSFELICRAKAKEVAADTYRTCVVENRTSEIEKLKKDYQERLRGLKEDYEKEIDKLGGKQKTSKKSDSGKFVASAVKPPMKKPMMDSDVLVESKMDRASLSDDSRMDLPEPVPVEKISVGH